jgi:membrane-associated phospholipid phosphatase
MLPHFPAAVQTGPFYQLMQFVYIPFEAPGASFPSSHVAVAILTVYFSFKYLRPIRWAHFGVMVLLCAATVYCRYHYVLDVVSGALAAGLLIPLGNRLYRKFDAVI